MFSHAPLSRRLAAVMLGATLALIAGCATRPVIRAHTAPGANVTAYRTYGFFEKLGTDDSSYSSLLSTYLKSAAALELQSRGYRLAESNPDLLVNFHLGEREKIQGVSGPSFGFGRGWGWRSGYSWGLGLGVNDTDLRSTTEGTLTIDVVDRAHNQLLWSGSAVATITSKTLDDPKSAVDATVPLIFAKYPGRAN